MQKVILYIPSQDSHFADHQLCCANFFSVNEGKVGHNTIMNDQSDTIIHKINIIHQFKVVPLQPSVCKLHLLPTVSNNMHIHQQLQTPCGA